MEKIISEKYIKTNILKGKYLNNIIFYDEGGEIFRSKYGYLERTTYPETIEGFELSSVRKALKINFTKKNNFFISSKDYLNKPAYDLYIYTGNGGDIEILKDFETSHEMGEGETWFTRNLILKSKFNFYFTNVVKCPEAAYGVKWEKTTAHEITIAQHARIKKTEARKKADEMRHNFNEKFKTNFYNNDQLKEVYSFLKEFYEGQNNEQ